MHKEDLIAASLCLVTAVLVLVESLPKYFGDRGEMGAGAYPTWIAILLAGCGISIVVQWATGNRITTGASFFPEGPGRRRLLYSVGAIVAHRVGTDILGFGIASFILMVFQMKSLGNHRWATILGLSVAFVVGVSYTFREWLYMALPRGFLGI